MSYKLVIFDFDCTLADSADWMLGLLNGVARKHRFREATPAEVDELRGVGNREIVARLGVRPWRLPFIARDLRRLSAASAADISLFDGAADLIADLAASGIATAIVSSNAEATVRRVLGPQVAEQIGYFDCGAAMFGKARKLRNVARVAGVRAADVLCVGDETRDIEAAKSAGLASAAVTWGVHKPEALRAFAPDYVVGSFAELRDVITRGP